MSRSWEPLPLERLKDIIAGTDQDPPHCPYSPDDVYRMASELLDFRETFKPMPEPPVVSPKRAAKIALYLEYIAWRLRVG